MIYQMLKFLFGLAVRIYFRKINIVSAVQWPKDKALVLVANHQSAIMDAILIAMVSDRPLLFLARGESFDTPFKRWLWSKLNMMPIYRPHITPELSGKNRLIMKQCRQYLQKGKALMIFPEGISHTSRRLQPIKTGAARIILEAAAENQYQDDIALIPIGLNYSNPHRFRSEVLINIGEPVDLKDCYQKHQKDDRDAVRQLSEKIELALQQITISLPSEELDPLFDQLHQTYREGLMSKKPQAPRRAFRVQQKLAGLIRHLYDHQPKVLRQLKKTLDAYMGLQVLIKQKKRVKTNGDNKIRQFSYKLIFQYAKIHYAPIIQTTRYLSQRLTKRPDFYGTALLCLGFFLTILFFPLQVLLVAYLSGYILLALCYALSLIACVPIALSIYDQQQMAFDQQQGSATENDRCYHRLEDYRRELLFLLRHWNKRQQRLRS